MAHVSGPATIDLTTMGERLVDAFEQAGSLSRGAVAVDATLAVLDPYVTDLERLLGVIAERLGTEPPSEQRDSQLVKLIADTLAATSRPADAPST